MRYVSGGHILSCHPETFPNFPPENVRFWIDKRKVFTDVLRSKKIHKQGIPAGLWTGEVCLSLLGGVCAASYWASLLHLQPTTDRPKMCHLPHPLSDNVAASLQNTTSDTKTNTNVFQIEIQTRTAWLDQDVTCLICLTTLQRQIKTGNFHNCSELTSI